MGAREKNFYNELFQRYGWVDEAKEIQDLFLSGRRDEAIAKVPDEYVDLATLCGDPGYVRERIGVFKESGVTYLNINVVGEDPLEDLSSRSRPGPPDRSAPPRHSPWEHVQQSGALPNQRRPCGREQSGASVNVRAGVSSPTHT